MWCCVLHRVWRCSVEVQCHIAFDARTHTHIHTHTHARTFVHRQASVSAHTHTHTHTTHTHTHTRAHRETHTHTHTHTQARKYIQTFARTHAHTRARTCAFYCNPIKEIVKRSTDTACPWYKVVSAKADNRNRGEIVHIPFHLTPFPPSHPHPISVPYPVLSPRGLTFTWWGCHGLCLTQTSRACPLLFILFLRLFLSLWPFQLYFTP